MTSQKPETQSQRSLVGVDLSEIEKRIMAHIFSSFGIPEYMLGGNPSNGSPTGRMTNAKPEEQRFHTGGVISAEKLREMLAPKIAPHIERIRVAPGKLEVVKQLIDQRGGVAYKREDQRPGTTDWSNFGGLTFVEDPMLCGFFGAMDWSNGKVDLFDWTPKEEGK